MTQVDTMNPLITENKALSIAVYKPENKASWDVFVSKAKNGIFLFYRDYMDYHSERFHDHSLLFSINHQNLCK